MAAGDLLRDQPQDLLADLLPLQFDQRDTQLGWTAR